MTPETLADAMGYRLSDQRYAELTPAFNAALFAAECTTVDRVAMFVAQIGHESGGLQWMEEIADGSAYEGRSDLGNVRPGDGKRFKGRGPIQVTGRHNYGKLSAWAFTEGIVDSSTFFVDFPELLSTDQYGFLGAVWYWTVARPDINDLSDRRDLETVTRRINGGLNGIQDRASRYNRALSFGDALLPEGNQMGTFTNSEGHEVTSEEALKWIDKRAIEIREQLCGGKDGYPGWTQLGGKTVVDALAAIGEKLGIEGFGVSK